MKAYRKMDVTWECISHILELREILLSFQTGFQVKVSNKKPNVERLTSCWFMTFNFMNSTRTMG